MVTYTDPTDNRYKSIFNHQEELETKLKNNIHIKSKKKEEITTNYLTNY
jgi:hypothetical protein